MLIQLCDHYNTYISTRSGLLTTVGLVSLPLLLEEYKGKKTTLEAILFS